MIDQMIMQSVMRDQKALGVSSLKAKFMVGTGLWRLKETDNGAYIIFTDDFLDSDEAFSVLILEDCELVEGERLVMFTSVAKGDLECSLVLFKDQTDTEDEE